MLKLNLPMNKKSTQNKVKISNGNEVTIDKETTLKFCIENTCITIFKDIIEVIESDKDLILQT